MKKLLEYITIKNLETDKITTVDDEGNIEAQDPEATLGADDAFGLEPEGQLDGLETEDPFATGELPADDLGGLEGETPPLEGEGEEGEVESNLFGGEEEEEGTDGDPDFQGVIRTVTGACLVYKRKTDEGTFEELWVYNVGKNMRNEVKTRRAILAGTDIPAQSVSSEDGTQECETTTIGNAQFLRVFGLPN
jgi:hypothetical protein